MGIFHKKLDNSWVDCFSNNKYFSFGNFLIVFVIILFIIEEENKVMKKKRGIIEKLFWAKRFQRKHLGVILLVFCMLILFNTVCAGEREKVTAGEQSSEQLLKGYCGKDGDNLTWELTLNKDNYYDLVIRVNGEMADYEKWYDDSSGTYYDTGSPWNMIKGTSIRTIKIEDGVTSIGNFAFYYNRNLLNVQIADSVKRIGKCAFDECRNLTELKIPDGVTEIGAFAFSCCMSMSGSIVIPEGVDNIEFCTFFSCKSLTSIVLPDTLTCIGSQAFDGCSGLSSIVLPERLTTIKSLAFAHSGLKAVYLPKSVKEISDDAFRTGKLDMYYAGSREDWFTSFGNRTSDDDGFTVSFKHNDQKVGKLHYVSSAQDIPSYKIYFDKGYEEFDCSLEACINKKATGEYNPQLAHMMIAMCNSVYDANNMNKTLQDFGFSRMISSYTMLGDVRLAYGLAKMKLENGTTLIFLVARGTEEWYKDPLEWVSNFNAAQDDNGQHQGFSTAADTMYDKLKNFLQDGEPQTEFSNTYVLMTGFSRGAGVVNLLSKRLAVEEKISGSIQTYAFACPDTAVSTPSETQNFKYRCIFNIADADDLVSWAPGGIMELFSGWEKYGNSYWYSSAWDDFENREMGMDAHDQNKYLNYLRSEKSIKHLDFKKRRNAKAYLNDAAGKRDRKFRENIKSTINNSRIGDFFASVGIHCPVDVEIYDSKGSLLGKILKNIVVEMESSKIHINVVGDEKNIYLLDEDTYTFRITALDNGTMEYIVQRMQTTDGSILENKAYTDIKLTEGKTMDGQVEFSEKNVNLEKVTLCVLDEDGNKVKEIMGDGTETKISTDKDTVNPEPTRQSIVTTTPKPTEQPEVITSPKPTGKPSVTASPKPTSKPNVTASPKPTIKPNNTEYQKTTDKPNTAYSPSAGMVLQDSESNVSYKVLAQGETVAFYQVKNKKAAKIVIPATVTINGITYKVTAISDNAFSGCKKLKKITIPASVTRIGKEAFYGCKKLKSITIKTPKLKDSSVGARAFKGIHKKAVFIVPKKQKKSYKKWLKKKGAAKTVKIK